MKAVILAGGEGTRLRPLTLKTPKSLLPICNVPFLEHQLGLMARHGITHAILLTGYLADAFEPFAARMAERGITLEISREEKPLGTCGAVRSVLDRLDGTTMVFNGDVLTDLDLSAMIERHRSTGAVLSIALKPVGDAGPYGLVPTDEDGRVKAFVEKPPPEVAKKGGNINAGTYLIDPRILSEVPPDEPWSFERRLFPSLVERGEPVYGFVSDDYWLDIGTPERYLQAHWDLMGSNPTLVDPSATIEVGATVGPRVSLGPGVVIRSGARVERSVFLADAVAEEGAKVSDSIVGPGAVASGDVANTIVG